MCTSTSHSSADQYLLRPKEIYFNQPLPSLGRFSRVVQNYVCVYVGISGYKIVNGHYAQVRSIRQTYCAK